MTDHREPAYVNFFGSMCLRDQDGTLRPPVDKELAILFDPDNGTLLSHGSGDLVRRKMAKLLASGLIDTTIIAIPTDRITEPMLDEINACLAISGRVLQLEARLRQIAPAEACEVPA